MKFQKLFIFTIAAVFAFCTFSCSSDDDPVVIPETPEIKKIPSTMQGTFSTGDIQLNTYNIEYDDIHRITEWEYSLVPSQGYAIRLYRTVSYEGITNKVLSIEEKVGNESMGVINYTYEGNKVIASNGQTFILNNKGEITELQDGSFNIMYEYDAVGNLIKIIKRTEGASTVEHIFTYDLQKVGAFKYVNAPQWLIVTRFINISDELNVGANLLNACIKIEMVVDGVSKILSLENDYSSDYIEETIAVDNLSCRYWYDYID